MAVNITDPNPSTIHLKACGPINQEEAAAGEAGITPGHLVKLNTSNAVVKHPTAGIAASKAFAIEDRYQGKGIDDAYASGDRCHYRILAPGDHVYALLADAENVVIGDLLSSKGDGTLRKVAGSDVALAVALEAKDLTASANTTAQRLRARII